MAPKSKTVFKASTAEDRRAVFNPGPDPDSEWTGAGDVVRSAAKKLGVKPCTPCEERRKALNRWFPFR